VTATRGAGAGAGAVAQAANTSGHAASAVKCRSHLILAELLRTLDSICLPDSAIPSHRAATLRFSLAHVAPATAEMTLPQCR
jgi:hypothetical protein